MKMIWGKGTLPMCKEGGGDSHSCEHLAMLMLTRCDIFGDFSDESGTNGVVGLIVVP